MNIYKTLLIVGVMIFTYQVESSTEEFPSQQTDAYMTYQRELLFLNSYKNELKNKINKIKVEKESRVSQAKKEILALQKQLVTKDLRVQSLERSLVELEREQEFKQEIKEQLDLILKQAQNGSLSEEDKVSQLTKAFDEGLAELRNSVQVKVVDQEYYNLEGEKTFGSVAYIGQISRFGLAKGFSGPLYPVGEKKFKLWTNGNKDVVAVLEKGELPPKLPMFLYESAETGYIPKVEKSFYETISAGGAIGWVILVLGGLAGVLSLWRFVLLNQAKNSSVERVVEALREHLKVQSDKVQDVIDEKILEESHLIDRFGQFILVLAAVAPLLGLLGTVTGMISTFDTITEFGTGNPKLLSGGISEALVTTMLGLCVAIPALVLGNILNSWSTQLKMKMEQGALGVCNAFINGESAK